MPVRGPPIRVKSWAAGRQVNFGEPGPRPSATCPGLQWRVRGLGSGTPRNHVRHVRPIKNWAFHAPASMAVRLNGRQPNRQGRAMLFGRAGLLTHANARHLSMASGTAVAAVVACLAGRLSSPRPP